MIVTCVCVCAVCAVCAVRVCRTRGALAQGAILTLESSQPLSCPEQKTTTQGTTTAAPPAPPKKEAVKATVAVDKVGWFEAAPELMPRYSEPGADRYVYVRFANVCEHGGAPSRPLPIKQSGRCVGDCSACV